MIDLAKMNRTELLCLVQGLTPMLRLNVNLSIAVDDSGNSFKVVTLPKHDETKPCLLGPKCVGLCGYDNHYVSKPCDNQRGENSFKCKTCSEMEGQCLANIRCEYEAYP